MNKSKKKQLQGSGSLDVAASSKGRLKEGSRLIFQIDWGPLIGDWDITGAVSVTIMRVLSKWRFCIDDSSLLV